MTKKKLRFLLLLLLPAVLATQGPLLVLGQEFALPRFECGQKFGIQVAGIGPRSQSLQHYRLFISRFHAPAERKADGRLVNSEGGCRDDVQGLIHFNGQNEDVVIRAMILRHTDALRRAYRFYGLDRPLTGAERKRAETEAETLRSNSIPYDILHLPVSVDGLAVVANLSCATGNNSDGNDPSRPVNEIRLSSQALSGIFGGRVTTWNDGLIRATNPGLENCDQAIRVAIRADVSGQTIALKDYLSKRNPEWRPFVEPQLNTQWPLMLNPHCRGLGDEGMATCVAGQPGAIGYVRFPEAFSRGLQTASVENRSLEFVPPKLKACTAAATSPSAGIPQNAREDWSGTSLTDPVGFPGGEPMYSICTLQFSLAFQNFYNAYYRTGDPSNIQEIRTVKDYLKWTLIPATQKRLEQFQLAPLPPNLRQLSMEGVESIVEE